MKHNNSNKNVYEKEFKYKVKTDGIIMIKHDKIIKKKPHDKLTVDLIFDKNMNVFLDMDRNIYRFHETNDEIKSF